LFALACLVACAAAACLSRGDPPSGRQVVTGRKSRLVGVLPATPEGTLRLLVMRGRVGATIPDLYLVSAPTDGSPPSEALVTEGWVWTPQVGSCHDLFGPCFPVDARGRLLLTGNFDHSTYSSDVIRFDPATGDRVDFGPRAGFVLSPSGRRLVVYTNDNAAGMAQTTLYEADDHAVDLPNANGTTFVGEALFYVTLDHQLMRVLPDAAPESVQANVTSFEEKDVDSGPLLTLDLATDDPSVGLKSVIDPVTLDVIFAPVPSGYTSALSSDGHWWLLINQSPTPNGQTYRLIEARTGAEEDFQTPGPTFFPQWRPGRAEIWASINQYGDAPVTWIKRPGEPLASIPTGAGGYNGAIFNDDGTYWYWGEEGSAKGRTSMFVGLADDPTAPLVRLNPDGSDLTQPQQLADGRYLIQAFYSGPESADLLVVDPRTGGSQLLGREGHVLIVGDRRVLAVLHFVDGAGDLAALDLDGGGSIPLATEFGGAAFAESRGGEPLGPGVRVAYQFQARFDSPYDGIWVATLP
jgi:hypothetical protein